MNKSFILVLGALVGCATAAPPPELVDARRAYASARVSGAERDAPVQLYDARTALTDAERAFDDEGAEPETRDRAYIAERRAQIAEASGRYQRLTMTRRQAAAERESLLASLHESSSSRLSTTQSALAQTESALMNERRARETAEEQMRQTLASLQRVAVVTEDTRGTVITLSGSVLFATGSSQLMFPAQQRLDEVASALNQFGADRRIVIEGHTDNVGNFQFNQDLSTARAISVQAYLASRGVDAGRMQAVGYGPTRPVASNGTPDGRANNRRVEIIVVPASTVTTTTTTVIPL